MKGTESDTLSYPGFILHPRLPNLQQLFLKRNHRISTSRNTSSLSYPDIVLYLIPHFSGFLLRNTDLHANHASLSKACTSKKHTFAGGNRFLFCQLTAGEI